MPLLSMDHVTSSLRGFGFSQPSIQDERGWLWFATILSAIYSVCFYGVRIFSKGLGWLWYDDLTLAVGYVCLKYVLRGLDSTI